jgi:hypothetical protein
MTQGIDLGRDILGAGDGFDVADPSAWGNARRASSARLPLRA